MAKLVYACEYCNQVFSLRSEAVRHEKTHLHKCENPSCGVIFVKRLAGVEQRYCSSTCNRRAKQQRWRERQKLNHEE